MIKFLKIVCGHVILPTHFIYVFYIIFTKPAVVYLSYINRLVSAMETKCVYCEVGTEFYVT